MIRRVRDRATFEALARARRVRRDQLWLRHIAAPDTSHARVAYAVGRASGPAVHRNRIRRRLRAAIREADREGRLGPGAYLFGAGPDVLTMPFTDLQRSVAELLETTGRDAP